MGENKPLTDEQINKYCELFKSVPHYNKENESIPHQDVPGLVEKMEGWPRTPKQVQTYVEMVKVAFKDSIKLSTFKKLMTKQHHAGQVFLVFIKEAIDVNQDGVIQPDEYEFGFNLLKGHDPTVPDKTYTDVVKVVDVNEDGKMSIEEIEQYLKANGILD